MKTVTDISTSVERTLSPDEWTDMQRNHREVLNRVLKPYLEKRARQVKDPVLDFLFEYYAFRPSHLLCWSPGFGRGLEKADIPWPDLNELTIRNNVARLDPGLFPVKRLKAVRWNLALLQNTADKPPAFGCFGMHEWAMVYRSKEVRHSYLPLRMTPDQLADFVESRPLVCTHYDAWRFFTKPARPMNRYRPDRENFQQMEQSGCIHTNMDLYKWAFKMYPWISSDIIREAFLLAVRARHIDMQASPYDLRSHGLDPIKIETEEGRADYLEKQRKIHLESQPIRQQLIECYQKLVSVST